MRHHQTRNFRDERPLWRIIQLNTPSGAEMSGSCETMSCDAPNTAIQACTTETVIVQEAPGSSAPTSEEVTC